MGEAGTKTAILVVEDDPIVRGLVMEIVQGDGRTCTAVCSCAAAREILQHNQFACALIDLGLPDGNGLKLLPGLKETHPWMVPLILTGDYRPETIVETMRAGAFDYVTKPFGAAALKAAVSRALEHHDAIRERDRLFDLLAAEREQLKVRVEEATVDLRQYAAQIETVNARLQSLLRLTQVSTDFYTDEGLFRGVFDELDKYMPIQCVALCASGSHSFLAAVRGEDGSTRVIVSDGSATGGEFDPAPDCKEPSSVAAWVERHTGLDVAPAMPHVYPQTFWGRALCTVGFCLPSEFDVDAACDEFLSMCAHFIATEWQEAQLFLHAVKEASLGYIAFELSKGILQGLTAIRTAADVAEECLPSVETLPRAEAMRAEGSEALRIICDNVEVLQRQLHEYRRLAWQRNDSVETVYLDEYVDQAIEMLSAAIQSRGIAIEKDYQAKCECVLLNGSTLSRTFLDLISSAVRTAETGGRILLRLSASGAEAIRFEICCDGMSSEPFGHVPGESPATLGYDMKSHPRFLLAQRTVQSCGGKLTLEQRQEGTCTFRIVLPRNAINPSQAAEGGA